MQTTNAGAAPRQPPKKKISSMSNRFSAFDNDNTASMTYKRLHHETSDLPPDLYESGYNSPVRNQRRANPYNFMEASPFVNREPVCASINFAEPPVKRKCYERPHYGGATCHFNQAFYPMCGCGCMAPGYMHTPYMQMQPYQ